MHYFQQLDETDCGAACLAMISSYYGKSVNIATVRKKAGTDVRGTNLLGLIQAAEFLGLKAIALKGDKEVIMESVKEMIIRTILLWVSNIRSMMPAKPCQHSQQLCMEHQKQ